VTAQIRFAIGQAGSRPGRREIGATLSASSTAATLTGLCAGSGASSLALTGLPGCKAQVQR